MEWKPYKYQIFALRHVIKNLFAGLILDMGLGKTVVSLTAVYRLIFWYMSATKVLVVAPKRVAEHVWEDELNKWDHLKGLTLIKVVGNERQRIKALNCQAHIYTISCDNIAWLVANYSSRWPFDMVIIDESSKFKSHASGRFKAIQKILEFCYRRVILTGTPASNGLIDLWAQIFILDRGQRLGKNITAYRDYLFVPAKAVGPHVFKYAPKNDTPKKIQRLIRDICISMSKEDYLKLPKLIERTHVIEMPTALAKDYKEFEREKIMEIAGEEITAINAAVLTGKLLQYANGFVYDKQKLAHHVHNLKMEALEELIEAANGQPVLLFYWFRHDFDRIMKRFKHLKPSTLKGKGDIAAWNRREIELAVVHPASAGHGLNLQAGGNFIIWFGPIWSAELDQQALARLHRQGQRYPVTSYKIVVKGTMDEDVMDARENKLSVQKALVQAVKARIRLYSK